MKKGKFIVFYGTNNLGKTTQAKLLLKSLRKKGIKAEYIKYPIYDLKPAGPLINSYLREGNPHKFNAREIQLIHYIDRLKYEPILKEKLAKGINIVAEDYFGTALAWGTATGVNRKFLEYFHSPLQKEDLAILFDGNRFIKSIEKGHFNENADKLIKKVRQEFLGIAKKFGWEKINANLPINKIQAIIQEKVRKIIHTK